jgi:hypothetical protein
LSADDWGFVFDARDPAVNPDGVKAGDRVRVWQSGDRGTIIGPTREGGDGDPGWAHFDVRLDGRDSPVIVSVFAWEIRLLDAVERIAELACGHE